MSRPMPNKACMSESTDAGREKEGDCAETCMQQAYNYLHSTHILSHVVDGNLELGEDPMLP
jgi:hypothetical protein